MKSSLVLTTRQKIGFAMFFLGTCIAFTACNTTWVSEAGQLIAAAGAAITQILGLIAAFGTGVSATDITEINSVLQQAQNDLTNVVGPLINDYNTADATAQPGILANIQAALADVAKNMTALQAAFHIANPATQAKVAAVIAAVTGLVQDIVDTIPALKTAMAREGYSFRDVLEDLRHEGKELPMNVGQFKKHFNAIMKAKTGDPLVDEKAPNFQLR